MQGGQPLGRSQGTLPHTFVESLFATGIDPHATIPPQGPVDGQHRPSLLFRQGREKTVRRSIVGLPGIPHRAAEGREEHEAVQGLPPTGFKQSQGPLHLGRQHSLHLRRGLAMNGAVPMNAGAMNHPVQGTVLPAAITNHRRHRRCIANIHLPVVGIGAKSGQGRQFFLTACL